MKLLIISLVMGILLASSSLYACSKQQKSSANTVAPIKASTVLACGCQYNRDQNTNS